MLMYCRAHVQLLPPVFAVSIRITFDTFTLNSDDIAAREAELLAWRDSKEARNGEKCSLKPIAVVVGKMIEYSVSMNKFKSTLQVNSVVLCCERIDINCYSDIEPFASASYRSTVHNDILSSNECRVYSSK